MKEVAYDVLEKFPPLPANAYWGEVKNLGNNFCLDTHGRHPPEKVIHSWLAASPFERGILLCDKIFSVFTYRSPPPVATASGATSFSDWTRKDSWHPGNGARRSAVPDRSPSTGAWPETTADPGRTRTRSSRSTTLKKASAWLWSLRVPGWSWGIATETMRTTSGSGKSWCPTGQRRKPTNWRLRRGKRIEKKIIRIVEFSRLLFATQVWEWVSVLLFNDWHWISFLRIEMTSDSCT